MTSIEVLEQRLAALEREVADLRLQVRGAGAVGLEERARVATPLPPTRPGAAPPAPACS
jgi:hypothetical protein